MIQPLFLSWRECYTFGFNEEIQPVYLETSITDKSLHGFEICFVNLLSSAFVSLRVYFEENIE